MDCSPNVKAQGRFSLVCRNADGTLAWREAFHNAATTAGLNDMLSVAFNSGTQKTTWYFGLIDNAGFSALAAADTISSHSGWSELTAYNEAARQQWVPASPSGGVISNTSAAVVTMSSTQAIKGAFIVSNSTKGGSTGVLWATGAFDSLQSLTSGQTLSLTYELTLTAA